MHQEEKATGQLFGKLFTAYDKEAFLSSVALFERRFASNDFPIGWFEGKQCLDVGCGGGRYSLALAQLGAAHCTGIDLSEASVADATRRAAELGFGNVEFRVASASKIPFEDDSFDCVLLSGVLQHAAEPIAVLGELSRVLRSGGMLYLLVYATGGVRWPLIQMLRPIAQTVGFEDMDEAVARAGLPVNKRRTYLDDLFVPYIDFYSWACLGDLLKQHGFSKHQRWQKGRLDHEESLASYLRDLEGLLELFSAAAGSRHGRLGELAGLLKEGERLCQAVVAFVRSVGSRVESGELTEEQGMQLVIGQGHHRVVAWRD